MGAELVITACVRRYHESNIFSQYNNFQVTNFVRNVRYIGKYFNKVNYGILLDPLFAPK